jgi:hypothetical protein
MAIELARWVWVDEFGSNTGLTRRFARSPRGDRARASAPRNHGVNHTAITSLTLQGLGPGLVLEGAMTTRVRGLYRAHPGPDPPTGPDRGAGQPQAGNNSSGLNSEERP